MSLEHSSIVVLLSGVAFLLFGLSLASDSLQTLAANRIRKILNRLSEKGIVGVVIGAILTLLMQSSGAVTATLVNLGTAGVLQLRQVMGVIIGSAIGAALTVQLISLHVSGFGLPLFVLGFVVYFMASNRRLRDVFGFLMAVGLLFFGLEMIRAGSQEMIKIESLAVAFETLRLNWVLTIILSAVLTSFFHSSTATLGVVMGFAASGLLDLENALIWIYGANVGTASTAIIAGLRGNYLGRQIAWANFFYRLASVFIFIPFSWITLELIKENVVSVQSQVATIYLALNVLAALVFFPLRMLGVTLIQKMITPGEGEEFGVRFLKRSTYESFALGLAHAKREILEMGDVLYQMTELSIEIFRDDNPDHVVQVRRLDDKVDLLLKEIKFFLIRVSDLAPEGLNQSVIDVISFGSDLEGAADIIDHQLLSLAMKMRKSRLEFSEEAWKDLQRLSQAAVRATSLSVTYFQTEDEKLGQQLLDLREEVRLIEQQSREAHIERLSHPKRGDSMATSAIFLETLNTYLQLVELLSRQALRLRQAQDAKNNVKRSSGNVS